MFTYIGNNVSVVWTSNAQAITSTGGVSTATDISQAEGPIIITVAVPAGGSNTMTIGVTQSELSGSGFAAVPAANLLNSSGVASTFATVSTTASTQTLYLQRVNSQRYLQLAYTGTALTQTVSALFAFIVKYTS